MALLKNLLFSQYLLRPEQNVVLQANRSFKRWLAPTLKVLQDRKNKLGPQPPPRRSTFLEWNFHAEIYAFSKRLKEDFDKKLLQQAFTTKSYIIQEETKQKELGIEDPQLELEHNQQLAEEGEKFIQEYIGSYLRRSLPRLPEEGIIAIQKYLTEDNLLAHTSRHIGTTDLILSAEFPVGTSELALVFHAVVGALLRSSGYERAGLFVRDFLLAQLCGKHVHDIWVPEKPLALLKDILARDGKLEPEPRLIGSAGVNTVLATYHVAVYSNKQFLGAGFGETVDIAVDQAALDALKRLFCTTENMKPLSFKINIDTENSDIKSNISLNEWSSKKLQNIVNF